jgi:flagellar FliL protein
VGVTLEVVDSKVDAQVKLFMPVIRNNILLALSDKTSAELMTREGKANLAARIQKETSRALGVDVADDEAEAEVDGPPKKNSRKTAVADLPITGVHFSNFIIQ